MARMKVAQVAKAGGPFEIVERRFRNRVPARSVSKFTPVVSVTAMS